MKAPGYRILLATLPSTPPDAEHTSEPWEANVRATCECLSWRGALDNLERRHAEDRLGETTYADFPLHARSAIVTTHTLIARGAIGEGELEAKMREVRARFTRA
jgi:nitrile hydratase beta subunit-like protein